MIAVVLGFILGIILGSFSKAAADRLGKNKSLLGRSYCLECKKVIRWYDLFPILSFLVLRGKCRHCRSRIPLANFLTEIFLGTITASLFYISLPSDLTPLLSLDWVVVLFILKIVFMLFIVVVATIIFWTDLETGYILDKITYPASIAAALFLLLVSSIQSYDLYSNLQQSNLGQYLLPPYTNYLWVHLQRIWQPSFLAVITAISLSSFFALLIIGTRGKGMGWGDVKYVFFIGLALGFPAGLTAVFLAFLLGALVSLFLIAVNKKHFGQTIPFGPFISAGVIISLFFSTEIINLFFSNFKLGY